MFISGRITLGVAAFVALLAAPSLAHHSAAMFDDEVELELSGIVTKFEYVNPHSWLYVDVRNEDGTVTEWGFELDAPPRLRRLGISPNYWKQGDAIALRTHPLKDGRPAGALVGATASEGNTFGNSAGLVAPTR